MGARQRGRIQAVNTTAAELALRLGARRSGSEYVTHCPKHEDANPSCWFTDGDRGTVIFTCRSQGCDSAAIAKHFLNGSTPRAVGSNGNGHHTPERTWNIRDAAGNLLAVHHRIDKPGEDKRVYWTGPTGEKKLPGGTRALPLYRSERLANVPLTETVTVHEGEPATDAAVAAGMVAVGTITGASSCPDPAALAVLRGRPVVLVPDHDEPGALHMAKVGAALQGVAASVRTVKWPGGTPKAHDAANITPAALRELVVAAVPVTVETVETATTSTTSTEDGDEPELSHDAIALEFTRLHRDELRFAAEWHKWLTWDGMRWKVDSTTKAYDLARLVVRDVAARLERRKRGPVSSAPFRDGVLKLAQTDPAHVVTVEALDSDEWLLNTPSGTVNLFAGHADAGTIRPHARGDNLTKATSVGPAGDCPRWKTALHRWFGNDEELVGFFRRWIGYTLTGCTQEQRFVFCWGHGGNGKTTAANTVRSMLGDYAMQGTPDMLVATSRDRHPCDLASLRGSRLALFAETSSGRRWDEQRVKALTGGEPISARYMRGDFFEFTSQAKLWISGNHKPGLRSVDEAMRRRLLLLPFDVTIPASERDPDLPNALNLELPGILAWAIEGCLEWQRGGLRPPAAVRAATDSYFLSQDAIGRWLEERCTVAKSETATKAALYASWKEWATASGEWADKPQRELLEELNERLDLDETRLGKARDRALIGIGLQAREGAE